MHKTFFALYVGIAGFLIKRRNIEYGGEAFGKAFENFIYHEIYSYSHYSDKNFPVYYWRTTSQLEVDFILGDHEVAVEVKSSDMVNPHHLNGLKSFSEEYKVGKLIVVSTDPYPRMINDIIVLPWKIFLERLWAGEII